MTLPRIVTEPLGGGPLARAAFAGAVPAGWYEPRPDTPEAWTRRVRAISASAPASWRDHLAPGFGERGAALDRLTRAAVGGAVVTTGQQPGLFGGPMYTLTKALGALALADELEAVTGLPVAPVFWAATDDSDFAEAAWTAVAVNGGFERLELPSPGMEGVSMRDVPLGDVKGALTTLERAAGSAIDPAPLAAARQAYRMGTTIGEAYLELLRALLEPLGVAVLDASHRALTSAEHPILCQALLRGGDLARALANRSAEMHAAGFEPQVPDVPALSLVFARDAQGRRVRVALDRAVDVAQSSSPGELGPNVLLRPVAERAILPTVAYVAGPGEFAYFAQVSVVAESLGAAVPLAVPRWSATVIEPHVTELLARYDLTADDLRDADAVAGRLARRAIPADVQTALDTYREESHAKLEALRRAMAANEAFLAPRVTEGISRGVDWRLTRFERRLTAAAKRREGDLMRDIGTLAGALYPGGLRQERMLNFLPFLARYGGALTRSMLDAARAHARGLVSGAAGGT